MSITNPLTSSNRNQSLIEEEVSQTSGTVEGGFVCASFYNNGTTDATVNGKKLPSGVSKNYPFTGSQYPNAIEYVGSATSELIITVIYKY